jgi:hypothetical chaperone protein
VSIAGDALDGALMRHHVAEHFGSRVTYKVPLGANVLTMPRSLMEKLCSPAEICLLSKRDILSFLRDVQSWALGPDDDQRVGQLLCLVEDALGFQVFEAIERTKRALSDAHAAPFQFNYPTINIEQGGETSKRRVRAKRTPS